MTVSERGMHAAICSQHHIPRRECGARRHRQTFRCGGELWGAMEELGRKSYPDRNSAMEETLKEWVALPDAEHEGTVLAKEAEPPPRSIRCSDELWDQVAATAQRLGIGNVSDGVRAALHRKAVLSGLLAAPRLEPAPVAADPGKAAVVENLRAKTDEVMERMKPVRKRPAADGGKPSVPMFMEPGGEATTHW